MKRLGLLGKNISYSFSRGYFTEKFKKLNLYDYEYVNFDLQSIEELPNVLKADVVGFNVTIPYKEEVMSFLDIIDEDAQQIGAVNTVKISDGKLIGYNTDFIGFEASLEPLLASHHKKALILGTGGAAKAIIYALDRLRIKYKVVSRNPNKEQLSYDELTEGILNEYMLIINCTPLGTFPNIEQCPDIPYEHLTDRHLLYDLIYNPDRTTFLKKGEAQGAMITNGLKMLQLQAEKAWEIWSSKNK